jgi:hypothetical protein
VVLGTASIAGAAIAVALWPQPAIDYGWSFWLWLACIFAYAFPFRGAERPLRAPDWRVVFILILVLAVAAALRFPQIEAHPGNIAIDEVYPGLEALHIARGKTGNVFSGVGWFNIPRLCFAYPALFMKFLGGNPFYDLRVSSAVMGLGSILATFLLGRRLLGDTAALIGAFLMAVGFWHVHNSRTGFPFIQSSFGVPLVLYLVVRARQDRSLKMMAIAGLSLGMVLQGYFPVRSLLLLVPLLLAGSWVLQREHLGRVMAEGAVLAGGTVLSLGPLLRSVPFDALIDRSYSILVFRPAVFESLAYQHRTTAPLWLVWENLQSSAGMFIDWADVCILSRSPSGLLDGVTLAATGLGMVIALMRGHSRALFLVVWVAVIFVFGVALTDSPRASYRLAPVMPALFLLAGFGARSVVLGVRPPRRWILTFIWPVMIAAFAGWITLRNHHLFFTEYSRKGDGREFLLAGALRLTSEECDGRMLYWLSGDQARQADLFELFCSDFRAIDGTDIPGEIDRDRDATFLVMPPWADALARLEACYPKSRPVTHRAPDNRFLFMRVDVKAGEIAAASSACAAVVDSEAEKDRPPAAMGQFRRPPQVPRPPAALQPN